jgi:hypothetical protein
MHAILALITSQVVDLPRWLIDFLDRSTGLGSLE